MEEEQIIITPYYMRRGDGLMGSKTVIRSDLPKGKYKQKYTAVLNKVTESPDCEYDGYCFTTRDGIYELKVSNEASCCDYTEITSSHSLEELKNREIEKWELKFPPEELSDETKKKLNLTHDEEDNPLFLVLTTCGYRELDEDIYLCVNNIHNGYYSRHALFTFTPRDKTGTEILLSVYL